MAEKTDYRVSVRLELPVSALVAADWSPFNPPRCVVNISHDFEKAYVELQGSGYAYTAFGAISQALAIIEDELGPIVADHQDSLEIGVEKVSPDRWWA